MTEESYSRIFEAERVFLDSGDEAAFECIMRGYAEGLIGFVQRFVNDFHAAEDIAQDVFVELWFNRRRFRRKSSLKSYLYSIGRHKALDHIKKASRSTSLEDGIDGRAVAEAAEEVFFRSEHDRAVLKALNALSREKREVLYLLYFAQFSFDELEFILETPKAKLYPLAKRAKEEIKIDLDLDLDI